MQALITFLGFLFLSTVLQGQNNIVWTNSWPDKDRSDAGFSKIRSIKFTTLFYVEEGSDSYHHHPGIAYFEGSLYASWSSSFADEDAPGQHVWFTISMDESNKKWNSPTILFPAMDSAKSIGHQGRALIPLGFCKIENEIFALGEVFDWTTEMKREGKGRVARSVDVNGKLGDIFWLVSDPPEPIPGYPSYLNSDDPKITERASAIRDWLADPFNSPPWEFVNNTTRPKANDGHQMCEMTKTVLLSDSSYLRMYRDCDGRLRNYIQLSRDKGETWDKAKSTNIPDSNSKTYLGTLPGGQVYMINNAVDDLWRRYPLSITLLNDKNEFFWTGFIKDKAPEIKVNGIGKGTGCQYPSAATSSQYLWVIYSIGKEDIEVARISLSSLPKE